MLRPVLMLIMQVQLLIKTISGYCTFVGGNVVTWRSKNQSLVACSSVETKYHSMVHGICELLWLKMLSELGFPVCESNVCTMIIKLL